MTSVNPLGDSKVELIELGGNTEKEDQNDGENDENNEYVDNDNDAADEPKEERKIKKIIVKKKLNEEAVRAYIKENIKQRKCDSIIPAAGRNDKPPTHCQCGLELSVHHAISTQQPLEGDNEQPSREVRLVVVQPIGEKTDKPADQQHQQQQPPPQIKWDPEIHSIPSDPDSYGTVFFDGFGQEASRKAPYVRLAHTTPAETVWTLLQKHWNLEPPKLIISVTGGAKRLNMKPRLLSTFRRGLINTVTSSDAWIITGGTKAGVMEIVGETILDYMLQTGGTEKRITCLGVASWGFVANKQVLVSGDGDGLFPAKYKLKDLNPGATPLDPFHTHFVLVDNGTDNRPGVEIKLRVELEAEIAKQCDAQLVLIVLEGGIQTLKTTAEAISKGTPVVVIKGSGRAADFIAYAFYKHKGYEKKLPNEEVENKFYDELRKKADKSFDWGKEKNPKKIAELISGCLADVKRIIEHKTLLMVFHLEDNNTTNEIDQAILKVLLTAREDTQSQVELALAWNCIEVARTDIFSMEARLSWQKVDLGSVMYKALIDNKVEFVQLFLDSGVKLSKFLTVGRLEDLYRGVLEEIHSDSAVELIRNLLLDSQRALYSLCCRAIETEEDDPPVTMTAIGDVLDSLADLQRNIYKELDEYPELDESTVNKELAKQSSKKPAKSNLVDNLDNPKEAFVIEQTAVIDVNDDDAGLNANVELDDSETRQQMADEARRSKTVENPERELLFWALLFGRKDLAMLFWRMGRDHIGGALTASRLWKKLAVAADREEELDLGEELENNSCEFQDIAIGVLNQCYQRDKSLAHFLLTRQLDVWANKTLFVIADDAKQMDFMEQACCQTQLNKSWTGAMAVNTPVWKIMLGLFWITIPFIKYSKNRSALSVMKKHEDPDADNAREPNSTNYYDVTLFGGRHTISLASALYSFMTAPQIKFCYFTVAYMVHLALFSYTIIMDVYPFDVSDYIRPTEVALWIWTGAIFLEECRQALTIVSPTLKYKIRSHFNSLWNIFDLVMFTLFIIAVILRLTLRSDHFDWTRMVYAFDLTLFSVRFLQSFFVEKSMGPLVIIIRGMLKDLTVFMMILLIFVANYGVVSRALMYPNITPTYSLLLQPYLMIFGSFDSGEIQGNPSFACSSNVTELQLNPSLASCPKKSWLIIVFFCVQLLIINIMMLNLLIAMFSFTFNNIRTNSETVWRYYRYSLIYEYFDKPTLPPPFIILNHLWRIVKFVTDKICGQEIDKSNHFLRILTPEENKKLTAFERTSMENYMLRRQKQFQENIDYKVSTTSDRVVKVVDDLEQLREQFDSQQQRAAGPSSPAGAASHSMVSVRETTSLGSGLSDVAAIKERLGRQEETMQQILQLLRAPFRGPSASARRR